MNSVATIINLESIHYPQIGYELDFKSSLYRIQAQFISFIFYLIPHSLVISS